jgi:flavin reductase (DIM6/NTAB) family NADH-FMN oxidoreductase RutF
VAGERLNASRGMTSQSLAAGDGQDARWLHHVVALAAEHATVATAQAPDGRLAAVRCGAPCVLSDAELLVGWTPAPPVDGAAVFGEATHFALNLVGGEGAQWLQRLGEAGHEKFARIAFEFGRGGAPVLECAVATLECVMRPPQRHGAYAMFIGRVLKVRSTTSPAHPQGEITDV